jgi:hypothetical protein
MSNIEARGSTRIYYLIGVLAVLHSGLLLVRATESLPEGLPRWSLDDRFWIVVALLWILWPAAMLLHPRRSWLPFAVALMLSLLFLVPSIRFYYWIVEEALHSPPSPTRNKPIVEKADDLGAGFRRVRLAEYMEGGFESVYHGEYLFYRDRKLADWLSASVAPSRRYAIYLDLESKRLVLFRIADHSVVELENEPVRDFGGFDWDEEVGRVTLRYSSARPPRDFLLKEKE